jgi:non-lysosomal glucosylceramidase
MLTSQESSESCPASTPLTCQRLPWKPKTWPILRHYAGTHLARIALPLGGIGTGTVSLGGRGELRDWQIMNRPARGFSGGMPGNDAPFFAIYVRTPDGATATKALLGPLAAAEHEHHEGRPANNHGLPRFREASFDAAYPFGQVHLSDPALPVRVSLRGFNPLIPGDADNSSLPVAVLSYEVTNLTASALTASVCGSLRNFIGCDGSQVKYEWKGERVPVGAKQNRNTFRVAAANNFRGLFLDSIGVDPHSPAWGTMALVTGESAGVSHRTSSAPNHWAGALLDFWDDFSTDGALTEKSSAPTPSEDDPMASLCVQKEIPANGARTFTFFLTWHFPNRPAWATYKLPTGKEPLVGNHYTTRFPEAWTVAADILPRMEELEAETLRFVAAVVQSDAPLAIREAALFNLPTLRSQTVFRLPGGELMAWEGVMAEAGSCFGSCTHVWNYESATPLLFGELARTMREVEFTYAMNHDGRMAMRVMLPLERGAEWKAKAADGQMGCIVKFYREWHLHGDRAFLERHWPQVRAALAYAWTPGGWDGDQDGVMEGCQHNTMDVDYHGPNPQMGFWYLAALRAAACMAKEMGEVDFAMKCEVLFARGSAFMDERLFNGDYFEHLVTDPVTHEIVDWSGERANQMPHFQLGPGCLVDQLVGQSLAHLAGLGELSDPAKQRRAIESVMRFNFLPSFANHFNNMRSYVIGDEAGLLMASWPRGRLAVPFPYFAEAMTGFEYTAAVSMIQMGMDEDALRVIRAVRDRFDGRKRNPFDEPECGHHYGRALASWNTLVAWSGFHYSAVERRIAFGARRGSHFWSNGSAWGTFEVKGNRAVLRVLRGTLEADWLSVVGHRPCAIAPSLIDVGQRREFELLPV